MAQWGMSTSGTPSGHCLPLTWGLASATEEPGRPTQPACLAERGGWQEGGEQPRAPLTPSTPTTTHSHHYHHCPAKGTLDKQQSPLASFHTDLIKLLDFCKGCFLVPVPAEESIIVMSVSVNVGTEIQLEVKLSEQMYYILYCCGRGWLG